MGKKNDTGEHEYITPQILPLLNLLNEVEHKRQELDEERTRIRAKLKELTSQLENKTHEEFVAGKRARVEVRPLRADERVKIVDAGMLEERFTKRVPDKAAIFDELKKRGNVPGAELLPNTGSLWLSFDYKPTPPFFKKMR